MSANLNSEMFRRALLPIAISALPLSAMMWFAGGFLFGDESLSPAQDYGIAFFMIGYALVLPIVYYKNRLFHKAHTNAARIKDRGFAFVVLLLFSLLNLVLPFLLLLTGEGMRNIGGLAYRALTASWWSLWLAGSFFLFAGYVSVYVMFCVLPNLWQDSNVI